MLYIGDCYIGDCYIGDCYIGEIGGFKQKRLFMISAKLFLILTD